MTRVQSLNTPFGARRFLTRSRPLAEWMTSLVSLNAPIGAWCFLTGKLAYPASTRKQRLNAPFGAWCFLTQQNVEQATQAAAS